MKLLILSVFILAGFLNAAPSPLTTTMAKKDSSFVLTATFTTTLSREKFMEVLFTYDHTTKYVKQPNLKISLVEEKPRINVIKYHYNYFVAKMDMAIENKISPDYNHFIFKQTGYSRTNKLIPLILSSGGQYDIINVENGKATVKYTQYGKMDQKISGIFEKMIVMESVGFIKSLLKYMATLETTTTVATKN